MRVYDDIDMTVLMKLQEVRVYSTEHFYTPEIIEALENNATVLADFIEAIQPDKTVHIYPRYLAFGALYRERYLFGFDVSNDDLFLFSYWDLKEKRVVVGTTRLGRDRLSTSLLNQTN